MDPKDRGKIRDNLDELVRVTKWNAVLENCVVRNGNLKKIMNTVRVRAGFKSIYKTQYNKCPKRPNKRVRICGKTRKH